MINTAMDQAYEDVRNLASSVSLPLSAFTVHLDSAIDEVETLLATTGWLDELEGGMRLRLDAFETAHG